jgi:hypothetical protein
LLESVQAISGLLPQSKWADRLDNVYDYVQDLVAKVLIICILKNKISRTIELTFMLLKDSTKGKRVSTPKRTTTGILEGEGAEELED